MTRVALVNVKYSPNLGDGLLCECLERELESCLPRGSKVVSVDLAGRQHYPTGRNRHRAKVMSFLERLPTPLRTVVSGGILKTLLILRLRAHYRRHLSGATVAIVGGGNLFSDADLNFPIKIAGALREAAAMGIPASVHAVGVTPTWSAAGRSLFRQSLAKVRLLSVSVRDPQSRDAWGRHFEGSAHADAAVAVDPGVLASVHFRVAGKTSADRPVGFCITDPLAVRYHSDAAAAERLGEWYASAIRSLVAHGHEVTLFTNGSPEDRDYLYENAEKWLRYAKGPVTIAPSFNTPADLARMVAGCTAVVGHRMHACIAAHSFGVPAIGLRWDVKLESFFAVSGRAEHMIDPARSAPEALGARVEAAIAQGVDPEPLIATARGQVRDLARMVMQVAARNPATTPAPLASTPAGARHA